MTISEGRRRPKKLSAETKWEIYLQVTSGAITQADAARKWGVDVSTVITIRRTVKDAALAALSRKPGRPGGSGTGSSKRPRRRSAGSPRRSRPKRSSWRSCGENPAGTERAGPGESPRRGERTGPQDCRRRCRRRFVAQVGCWGVAGLRRPGASLAGPPPRAGHSQRPCPGRRCGPWAAGVGDRGDPRGRRGMGADRPVPPQARPPRLLRGPGMGGALDVPARSGCSRPCAGSAAPGTETAKDAVAALAGLGAEPGLDLGRHPLRARPALRVRHRRHGLVLRLISRDGF